MTKVKKRIIITAILIITCIASSITAIAVYSNFSMPEYEKGAIALVGEENLEKVKICTYKYQRYYIYTDGTKSKVSSGSGEYEFNWN